MAKVATADIKPLGLYAHWAASLAGTLHGDVEGIEGGVHHAVAAPLSVPHLQGARLFCSVFDYITQ
jgi:hypothetical protein